MGKNDRFKFKGAYKPEKFFLYAGRYSNVAIQVWPNVSNRPGMGSMPCWSMALDRSDSVLDKGPWLGVGSTLYGQIILCEYEIAVITVFPALERPVQQVCRLIHKRQSDSTIWYSVKYAHHNTLHLQLWPVRWGRKAHQPCHQTTQYIPKLFK